MTDDTNPRPRESEVAMWHRLSGLPDNVTDDGQIVPGGEGRRGHAEKEQLRAAIADLLQHGRPDEVRSAARLAASYLIAGDAETARRYVSRGYEFLEQHKKDTGNEGEKPPLR
jgi:hypothetical protein